MKTGVSQMKCGGCGHDKFRVFTQDPQQKIMVECEKCKSVSEIVPVSNLKIEWYATGSNGCLCVME